MVFQLKGASQLRVAVAREDWHALACPWGGPPARDRHPWIAQQRDHPRPGGSVVADRVVVPDPTVAVNGPAPQ